MATNGTTRRVLAAYTDREPWKSAHDEAQTCLIVEEKMAWGVVIFQGLLNLEVRLMKQADKDLDREPCLSLEVMPLLYKLWLDASEFFLKAAQDFVQKGFAVEGLTQFKATVEEARCLCEMWPSKAEFD